MTPRELRRLAFHFRASRALFCAAELGLLAELERGPAPASELAERCQTNEHGMQVLLDALAAIDILERRGTRYALPTALEENLAGGGPEDLTSVFLHDLWHWTLWARLDQAVRTGEKVSRFDGDPHLSNPEVLKRFFPNYVGAMEQTADDGPRRVARALAALEPHRVLDLGGGTGPFLAALLELRPGASGTLAELPFVVDTARARLEERKLGDRVEVVPLNFEQDPIPEGHDLILLSRVLMSLPAERARRLVQAASDALPVGGTLAIHDYDSETQVGALFGLDMLLNTGGAVHRSETILDALREAGLESTGERSILAYTRLWTARKPETNRRRGKLDPNEASDSGEAARRNDT